jgi:hypothetical protein
MDKISSNSTQAPQPGQWISTGEAMDWKGVCARCGQLRDALDLELWRKPFTKDDHWVCKVRCSTRKFHTPQEREMLRILREMKADGNL